jgi:hypothetical protein
VDAPHAAANTHASDFPHALDQRRILHRAAVPAIPTCQGQLHYSAGAAHTGAIGFWRPASALRWAGLRAFLKHILLQHRLVQAQVSNELLDLAILSSSSRRRRRSSAPRPAILLLQVKNGASQIPIFRQTSATAVPLSDWRNANAIRSSLNLFFHDKTAFR